MFRLASTLPGTPHALDICIETKKTKSLAEDESSGKPKLAKGKDYK
jgi:hypothetical protein